MDLLNWERNMFLLPKTRYLHAGSSLLTSLCLHLMLLLLLSITWVANQFSDVITLNFQTVTRLDDQTSPVIKLAPPTFDSMDPDSTALLARNFVRLPNRLTTGVQTEVPVEVWAQADWSSQIGLGETGLAGLGKELVQSEHCEKRHRSFLEFQRPEIELSISLTGRRACRKGVTSGDTTERWPKFSNRSRI